MVLVRGGRRRLGHRAGGAGTDFTRRRKTVRTTTTYVSQTANVTTSGVDV